jgi:hypothetical protein
MYDSKHFIIQADGDELEYIRRLFPSMIIAKQSVITWHGSVAMTIAASLQQHKDNDNDAI